MSNKRNYFCGFRWSREALSKWGKLLSVALPNVLMMSEWIASEVETCVCYYHHHHHHFLCLSLSFSFSFFFFFFFFFLFACSCICAGDKCFLLRIKTSRRLSTMDSISFISVPLTTLSPLSSSYSLLGGNQKSQCIIFMSGQLSNPEVDVSAMSVYQSLLAMCFMLPSKL